MKIALIILAALVLIGGGYYWYSQDPVGPVEVPEVTDEADIWEENNDQAPAAQGKLNIDVVCEGALAYMTFPDGESAAQFVAECKAGEHPEVIERYKLEMDLGDGALI